ncbi:MULTISPECIES: hypothetical protein [Moorena]|uniref:hypothetical protein n=1 Tax=Moorena TaxID=1155738 RepID=UPI0012B51887|nr:MULTISPECIES: hypothetical protein [Moorena]NET67529.1 hypothetical protein [Moorena sp. SIO1G6]NEP31856.1 hypothetical protein [Moorena sp. SIO3B2]NEQ09729.1 hypothetical protein [Moorena sp. SIO4E2]NER90621.1 hypothetical protein [Moorena sp. SIO3A2]NES46523.1 hypothetical protein [Moorena sp. SIO2C4]
MKKRCRGATRGEFNYGSNAPLRSWGASAVLGVPPMSNWRGFPHERLHQDMEALIIKSKNISVSLGAHSRFSGNPTGVAPQKL